MKSHLRKPTSVLMTIVMILSMMSGLTIPTMAAGPATYVPVAAPVSGNKYLIAYKDGSDLYVLDHEGMATTDPSTQNTVPAVHFSVTSSGAITTEDESLVWNITSSGSDWLIQPAGGANQSRYLYPGTSNQSLYLNSTSRAWVNQADKLSYTRSSNTYYLRYSGSGNGFQCSTTDSSNTITFYELTDPNLTPAPQFSSTTYRMPTAEALEATYALTTAYTSANPVIQVYDSDASSSPSGGVTAGLSGSTLTLTFTAAPAADATYYLSVKDGDLDESARTPLTVNAFVETAAYTRVSAIQSGGTYLIVGLDGADSQAMGSSSLSGTAGYLTAVDISDQVSGDTVLLEEDEAASLEWIPAGSDSSFTLYNNAVSKYCTLSTEASSDYGLNLGSTGTTWAYDNANNRITYTPTDGETTYSKSAWLYYSTSNDGFRANTSTSATPTTIYLYQKNAADTTLTPAFTNTTCQMPDNTATTAAFTLTTPYANPSFHVYDTSTGDSESSVVTAGLSGSTLTLTFTAAPTADATFYLSATDGTLGESARTALTVKTFAGMYTYTRVNAIHSGGTYLIVGLDDTDSLAMSSDILSSAAGYLVAVDIGDQISGDTIMLEGDEAASLEWIPEGSDSSFTLYNNAVSKYNTLSATDASTGYGLNLGTDGTVWAYDSASNQVTYTPPAGESTYTDSAWLYYSTYNDGFRMNTDSTKACTVHLYQKGASANHTDANYLAFTSDVHYNTSDDNHLEDWLDLLDTKDVVDEGEIDYMGFCGDMGDGGASEASFWSYAQAMLDTTLASPLISKANVGNCATTGYIYTPGNHEYMNGGYPTTSSGTADEIIRIGKAAETDNYIVYCFGSASSSQTFDSNDISTLDTYLETAPDNIPIIILSHYPIHYFSSRTTTNADDLIDVLNDHPNTVFLWGHNHTLTDTNYGIVYSPDTDHDTIQYASSESEEINFTYAAAGCMSDSDYGGGSGNTDEKGMIMEIAEDGSFITITYYGLDGEATGAPTAIEISEGIVSANANLSALAYTLGGTTRAVPAFSSATTTYNVTLPYGTAADSILTLDGTCSSSDATVTANTGVTLVDGSGSASITVTAEDGTTTKTYTVQFSTATTEGTEYVRDNAFEDGGEYLIAYEDSGVAYCLDADTVSTSDDGDTAAAASEPVTGNTITTSNESILWTADASDGGWLLSPTNGSGTNLSLYMGNGPVLYLDADGRAMTYDDGKLSYTSANSGTTYYLSCSGGVFSANTSTGSNISLFTRPIEATGITLPETASVREGRTVQLAATLEPATANSPITWAVDNGTDKVAVDQNGRVTGILAGTATISATVNGHTDTCEVTVIPFVAGDTRYLGFTSDTHYESGETNNLDNWLTDLSDDFPELDYMSVGGDIASTSSSSVDEYWEFVQDIIDTVDAHDTFVPNGGIYTTGNHEQYAGPNAGGDYENEKDSNDTAKLLTQNGEAARTGDYAIYCFGSSNNVTSSTVQEFTDAQINLLEDYLEEEDTPDDIPIFILSHYPLHYDGNRIAEQAENVIDLLNEYPNVVFLWGHNHSDAGDDEDGYDNILEAGTTLQTINQEGGTVHDTEIQFTYAPAGCMSDDEYSSASAAIEGKGLVAAIADMQNGKEVTLTYYDLDGEPFSISGKTTTYTFEIIGDVPQTYVISWDTDGDSNVDQTTTVAYGNTPSAPTASKPDTTAYTYTFAGWSPPLEAATAAKTYTATFSSAVRTYPIHWDADGSGTSEDTTMVAYNQMPTHADGSKASTADMTYTFVGWTPALSVATGETTYTAQFSTAVRKYHINWDTDGDGTPDDTTLSEYGTMPTHADGSRAATSTVKYTFTGWSPALTPTTGEKTYVAQFSSKSTTSSSGNSGGGSNATPTSTTVSFADQLIPEGSPDTQAGSNLYQDVPAGSWYESAIAYMTSLGLMNGVRNGQFAPNATLTRGMLVTVLWKMENKPATIQSNPFADVPGIAWYTDAVAWAAEHHLVRGYNKFTFGPEDQLTREQIATILYRYAVMKDFDVGVTTDMTSYEDHNMISDWALPAMRWSVCAKLISGVTPERLAPKAQCSRAECAVILARFIQPAAGEANVAIKP